MRTSAAARDFVDCLLCGVPYLCGALFAPFSTANSPTSFKGEPDAGDECRLRFAASASLSFSLRQTRCASWRRRFRGLSFERLLAVSGGSIDRSVSGSRHEDLGHRFQALPRRRAGLVVSGCRGPGLSQPGSDRQRRGRVPISFRSPQERRACAAAFG